MSESTASNFRKVISGSLLLRPPLVAATVASVMSAFCLFASLITIGGLAFLLNNRPTAAAPLNGSPMADSGLLAALDVLPDAVPTSILRNLISGVPMLHSSQSAMIFLVVVLCVLFSARWGLRSLSNRLVAKSAAGSVKRLRNHIHRQSLRLDPGDLTGSSREATHLLFENTAEYLETCARNWGRSLLFGIADLISVLLLAALVHWRASVECLIPVFVSWYIMRLETNRYEASSRLLSEQVERGLSRLAEGLQKTRIVAGYGMESFELEQFENNLQQFGDRCNSFQKQKLRGQWVSRLIIMFCLAVPGIIIAQHILSSNSFGIGGGVVLAGCLVQSFLCLNQLQRTRTFSVEGGIAADEISNYLRRIPAVSQTVGAKFLEPMSRTLHFDQICLETDEHVELLRNLDLKIEFGSRVALLSLNHQEVDALVSLICRFNDPLKGQVLIDGQDISRVTLESLRAEAMIVTDTDQLFNASVLDNVTCGQKDISRQDAIEACRLVHAESFIRQLPKSYETLLGEHGTQLDAGQSYRLALARAIARNPALLVIEEPDAVLDGETKALLDDAYQRICENRTVIFLPRRLSTVKKCNRIVMLHQGRVAVDGRHEDLVRSSELYRHWEYVRFNVFRAE